MRTSRGLRRFLVTLSGLGLFAGGMATAASLGSAGADSVLAPTQLPGFGEVVSLSHTNDPAKTPLFPGDPRFRIETVFTAFDPDPSSDAAFMPTYLRLDRSPRNANGSGAPGMVFGFIP